MTNIIIRFMCKRLINIYRRYCVPPPEIEVIAHYAHCENCKRTIERQGWCVEFKHDDKKIYEVTFKAKKSEDSRHLIGDIGHEEEGDEEDEDEEFEVKRPTSLSVGERPKASFYV